MARHQVSYCIMYISRVFVRFLMFLQFCVGTIKEDYLGVISAATGGL